MQPLFLFTGPEFGERNDAIEEFRKRLVKKNGELDSHTLYAADTNISDVITLLQNGSLFASARFIVLRNAEIIKKKEDIEMIAAWQKGAIKSATNDSWLFLVSDEIAVDKKLENIVAKENKKIFWEMFEDRKEQWLYQFFQKAGYAIDASSVELILDLIENNTEALRNECSRFFSCFEKGHLITTTDVDNILAHNREESAFTLFDALSDASKSPTDRLDLSLSILQKIRHSKESSGVQLIAGLTYCFRSLQVWHQLSFNNYPTDFDMKKAGFTSKKRQMQYKKASSLWNNAQTMSCLALLADSDMQIRSTGTSVEDSVLQMLVYSLIMKKGEQITEYQ